MITLVTIFIMVWNVHGLPLWFGTNSEDVRLVLEVAKPDMFFGQEVWTKGMYTGIKRAFVSPFWYRRHQDAGLAIVKQRGPKIEVYEEHRFKYTTWSKFDFLVSKGFQVFINEDNVMFINAHLDAGGDSKSQCTRASQLSEILERILTHKGHVVMVGDLNLSEKRPYDVVVLNTFLEKAGLRVAVRSNLDFILVSAGMFNEGHVVIDKNPSDHAYLATWVSYSK